MVANNSNSGFIKAGHVGGRASQARSYWDQLLPIDDVARLLRMRVTELKQRVCANDLINGLPAPKPCLNENDKMFFRGRDIEKLVLAQSLGTTSRSH